jgi:hypothetical protein
MMVGGWAGIGRTTGLEDSPAFYTSDNDNSRQERQ